MLSVQEDTTFDPAFCECCGQTTRSISGWISSGSDTVAAYLIHWTDGRPDHGANFDLIIGKWGDRASPSDRQAASVVYSRSGGGFIVIDASTRPFARGRELFCHALSRDDVVSSPIATQLFTLLDAIWLQDSRITEIRGEA